MNAARRKRIEAALAAVDEAIEELRACATEEIEYRDNMPENMQDGPKGEKAEADADALEMAADDMENAAAELREQVGL